MIAQCISAVFTLAIVVLAILIMTRAISLDDTLKTIGKKLALIVLAYFVVCALGPPLRAGMAALASLLTSALRWLAVAVIVAGPLILVARVLLRRFSVRQDAGSRD
jgi:hypothetical protein